MNEVFDSEQFSVEYKKDDNIVLVVLKGKAIRDSYRTPMMHAADMVMRHSCKVMAVDFKANPELSEKDLYWSKKVLFNNLKKSGLETLALIDDNDLPIIQGIRVFCGNKFRTIVCKDYDEVKARISASAPDVAGKFADMTREQALEYMGLGSDADIKEIDDRFWQMSKKYRGKDDPESMAMEEEISAVYDIASGRRDIRIQEEKQRENEPKYFGRYKSDWQTIIHYNWKNWLLGAVVGISIIVILVGYFLNAKNDCSVLVFGHMYLDNTYMRQALEEQGLKNPYVGLADVVVPNDERIPMDEIGNESFNAQFYTNPDVLISDNRAYKFYFSVFKDLGPLYDRIMAGLSDEAKAGVKPIYMSERESVRYKNDMLQEYGLGEEDIRNPAEFPDDPVLIGFEITDQDVVTNFGVEAKWKSRQTTLMLGQCKNSTDDDMTVKIITSIINSAYAKEMPESD